MRLFILLSLFHLCLFSSSDYVVINEKKVYALGLESSYYVDESKVMDIESIKQEHFIPSQEEVPSYGFADVAYWLKISLKPDQSILNEKWFLKIDYPLLDHLALYAYDNKGRLLFEKHGGELEPFENREIKQRDFIFEIPFESDRLLSLYLRVETSGTIHLPIKLVRDIDIIETQQDSLLLSGLYYGLFIIIFVYSFILFIYTKDKNYVYYLFFLSTFVMWQLSFDGFGVEFFWTDMWWNIEKGTVFWMILAAFASVLFGKTFLQTSLYAPRLDRILLFFIVISFLAAMAATFLDYSLMVQVGAVISILMPIFLLISGIVTYRAGNRAARFYILGWTFFLVGSVLFALNKFDIIGGFYLINYAQQVGSAFEMIFLSWALADRIHLLQVEYNIKMEKLNVTLHQRVAASLEEMRKKDQVLAHQARLASIGETIEQIAHQWRQPLNNLALINQDTYFKRKLGTLDEVAFDEAHNKIDENLQFMSKTIDDFRDFFNVDDSDEDLTCKPSLIVDHALILSESLLHYSKVDIEIECISEYNIKIRKNEMSQVIMNLIKNSIDAIRIKEIENGYIKIRIDSDLEHDIISFEDNGGGIKPAILDKVFEPYVSTKKSSGGTGIGLYMSRLIIEKYEGEMRVKNTEHGALFEIRLPRS